jgi:HlyD family secretion protein
VLDQEKQARTVEIEAEIDDADKSGLLPGYSADVEVILASRDDTLRIPTSVISNGNIVFVYDAARGRLEERPIETGIANWEFTEVTSGLNEGDRIVSSIDRAGVRDDAAVRPE